MALSLSAEAKWSQLLLTSLRGYLAQSVKLTIAENLYRAGGILSVLPLRVKPPHLRAKSRGVRRNSLRSASSLRRKRRIRSLLLPSRNANTPLVCVSVKNILRLRYETRLRAQPCCDKGRL